MSQTLVLTPAGEAISVSTFDRLEEQMYGRQLTPAERAAQVPTAITKPRVYVGMDTETTSLNEELGGIIQIGCAATDSEGHLVDVFKSDCNPGKVLIEQSALAVNGFSEERIKAAAPLGLVIRDFFDWVTSFGEDMIPVFQNAPFDVAFLKKALRAHNISNSMFRRVRDTATLSPAVWGEESYPRSLKFICDKLEIRNVKEHDAFADAFATITAFHMMSKILKDRRQHACPPLHGSIGGTVWRNGIGIHGKDIQYDGTVQ